MPNWVTQKIIIKGNKEQLAEFIKVLKEGIAKNEKENTFGFCNIFIPQPKELQDSEATNEAMTAQKAFKKNYERFSTDPLYVSYVNLFDKYGYTNWYDWAVANWGTKWDTSDALNPSFSPTGLIEIQFDTPWCPVVKCLTTISQRYPKLNISVIFADEQVLRCFLEDSEREEDEEVLLFEDMLNLCGVKHIYNGRVTLVRDARKNEIKSIFGL